MGRTKVLVRGERMSSKEREFYIFNDKITGIWAKTN